MSVCGVLTCQLPLVTGPPDPPPPVTPPILFSKDTISLSQKDGANYFKQRDTLHSKIHGKPELEGRVAYIFL